MDGKSKFPKLERCNPMGCYSNRMMMFNRIIAGIFRKHLLPLNVTDSQLSILFVITKGDQINQKKLSEILFLEKSSTNRNLKRLIEKKYIDNSKFYFTTQKGKGFLEKAIPSWDLAMAEVQEIIGNKGDKAFEYLSSTLLK